MPRDACVAAPGMPRAQVAALEYMGGYRVDAVTPAERTRCEFLLLTADARSAARRRGPAGSWSPARSGRPTDEDITAIYRAREREPR